MFWRIKITGKTKIRKLQKMFQDTIQVLATVNLKKKALLFTGNFVGFSLEYCFGKNVRFTSARDRLSNIYKRSHPEFQRLITHNYSNNIFAAFAKRIFLKDKLKVTAFLICYGTLLWSALAYSRKFIEGLCFQLKIHSQRMNFLHRTFWKQRFYSFLNSKTFKSRTFSENVQL